MTSAFRQPSKNSRLFFRSVAGTLDWYSTDFWSDQYGYSIIEYSRSFAEGIRFLPYAEDFLTALKRTGIRSTIVTNAHPDILALKNRHTGIVDKVDDAISSHSIGFAKESEYFWQHTQTRLGFNKAKTLFFDDSAAVVNAALKFGIEGSVTVCLPDTSRPKNVPNSNYAIDQFQDVWPSPLDVSER
jgi:putative hydrolase of the HAD superfamily